MQLKETEILLREMFAIDGRILDADRLKAWHNAVGFMPLDVAQEALRIARRDERINYIEPKHIVAKAREAAMELDRQAQKEEQAKQKEYKGVPCPHCKHKMPIVECNICCKALSDHHKKHEHLNWGDEFCEELFRKELLA